jgi:hypothetical protein
LMQVGANFNAVFESRVLSFMKCPNNDFSRR